MSFSEPGAVNGFQNAESEQSFRHSLYLQETAQREDVEMADAPHGRPRKRLRLFRDEDDTTKPNLVQLALNKIYNLLGFNSRHDLPGLGETIS